jgi:molecular chaperone GrpE
VRQLADLDNARKRIDRERREDAARITANVVEPILTVLDGFERALAAHSDPAYEDYRTGFELIYRQLLESLERLGVQRIEAMGRPFDPHVHQAVERVESSEHEDGTVVEDLRHGYKLRERVLRPALVRVAFRPATELADSDSRVN